MCEILLAYEMIRWGSYLGTLDAYGDTPLMTGMQMLHMWKWFLVVARGKRGSPASLRQVEQTTTARMAQTSEVVQLFVRHHADVNLSSPGHAPAHRVRCKGLASRRVAPRSWCVSEEGARILPV